MPNWDSLDMEVHCPRCGYDLRLLPQPRCPECGLQFEWAEVIAAARQRLHCPLFEYQWRYRPVRSFFSTLGRALVPWRLWKTTRLAVEPKVRPLLAMVPLVLLLHVACVLFLQYVWEVCFQLRYTSQRGWRILASINISELSAYVLPLIGYFVGGIVIWLMIQVFQQSIARYSVRQGQILRVVVLAWVGFVVLEIICSALMISIDIITVLWPILPWTVARWTSLLLEVVPILLLVVSLCCAMSIYLRIRRGWVIGLLSVFVTFLFFVTLVFSVSVYVYDSDENPFIELAALTWPNITWLVSKLLVHT
ncbi:MAG: hypothetical protein KAY37_08720 [Phycisphaerae bacterium]|nr:hypothetical protein [Phycisphaerae bacterium]